MELAKPSPASTPQNPRTKYDDFIAGARHCTVKVQGDGVKSIEGLELDESDGSYGYDGDCRTYMGTAATWSVKR